MMKYMDMEEEKKLVSIIVPTYNEERYIGNCIESLLLQDYSREYMEWIFIDGFSKDNTKMVLNNYVKRYPDLIKIYENPNRTVPYAMNIGIRNAKGKYIIRLDAHAEYPQNYISKCVFYLETTDNDNVGGFAETKGKGEMGNIIAKILSSKFGVGNSMFRIKGKGGNVDTVPFGAFKREVFEKYGNYDERLTRNEDNELNYRIRKNGGKIYLAEDIHFSYYCRDCVAGMVDMAMKNGMWSIIAMRLVPGSMQLRHFIPFMFVLSILIFPFLCSVSFFLKVLFCIEIGSYFLLDFYCSIIKANKIKEFILLFLLFPVFHIAYGIGSIWGLFKLIIKNV